MKIMTRILRGAGFLLVFMSALGSPVMGEIDYVYLIPLSHLDIGFTATPREVAEEYKEIIDEAIDYAESDSDFKYTVETLWQLEQWLLRSTGQEIDRFRSLVLQGKIGLSATYHTPHTATMAVEEVNRFLYPALYITEFLDVPFPRSAVLDDVPGYSWAVPGPLTKCGTNRLMTGVNTSLGGQVDIPVSDTAFHWEGADSSGILTWISRSGYAEGFWHYGFLTWHMLCDSLPDRLAEFEEGGYPYDAIAVMYGFDNAHTGLGAVNLARRWNDTYGAPRIVCGTVDDFFDHMVNTYGDNFTTYRGDWSGTWDSNSICTPISLGYVRNAQAILPGAEAFETIASVLDLSSGGARSDVEEGWRHVILFDEHSGGGGSWPGLLTPEQVRLQNVTWVQCAKRALQHARDAGKRAVRDLSESISREGPFVAVFNGHSIPRSGPVRTRVPDPDLPGRWVLRDEVAGNCITVESDGVLEFVAREVPSFGYRVYPLAFEGGETSTNLPFPTASDGNVIESDFFRIEADTSTGYICSLIDKRYGRELVKAGGDFDFGALISATNLQSVYGIYNKVPGTLDRIEITEPAADMHRMRICFGDTPMEWIEYTLIDGIEMIFLAERFDKGRIPFVPYEAHSRLYGMTFPFSGRLASISYGGPAGALSPGEELLPGAFGANFCINDWIDLSIDESYGITWSSRENLVHEFASMQWLGSYEPESPDLTVRVCRHADEAMFKGDVIGEFEDEPGMGQAIRQYQAFSPYDGPYDPVRATSSGAAFRQPLHGIYVDGSSGGLLPAESASLLTLSDSQPGGVFLSTFKHALCGDGIILRIKELAGLSHHVEVWSDFFSLENPVPVDPVERDAGEKSMGKSRLTFHVKPYECISLRCDIGE